MDAYVHHIWGRQVWQKGQWIDKQNLHLLPERIMLSRYHKEITSHVLGRFFTPDTLAEIIRANVEHETLSSLFGAMAHRHVCDCIILRVHE